MEEENGLSETLEESETGVYQSKTLIGIPGNRYRLKIVAEGDEIESSWETLTSSASLDSIYYTPETKATTDKDVNEIGLQFYAHSHGTLNDQT